MTSESSNVAVFLCQIVFRIVKCARGNRFHFAELVFGFQECAREGRGGRAVIKNRDGRPDGRG